MMKTYYWTILSFLFTINLVSQSEPIEASNVRSETITSVFQLKEKEGIQFLQNLQTTNQTLTEVIWLTSEDIHLKEGTDLAIHYQLQTIEKPLEYDIAFRLFDENGRPITLPIWRKKGDVGILNSNKKHYEFILQDILEEGLYYGKTYRLEIQCQLRGIGLKCTDPRPKFDWSIQKRWHYYTPIGIGTMMAIIGGINRESYKPDYARYLDQWNSGSAKGVAQPFYDTAVKKQDRNANLIYIGTGIAVASGLGLLINYWRNHLPKLRTYDKYCKPKTPATIKKQKIGLELLPSREGVGLALQF